jgi:hypothetical protein
MAIEEGRRQKAEGRRQEAGGRRVVLRWRFRSQWFLSLSKDSRTGDAYAFLS